MLTVNTFLRNSPDFPPCDGTDAASSFTLQVGMFSHFLRFPSRFPTSTLQLVCFQAPGQIMECSHVESVSQKFPLIFLCLNPCYFLLMMPRSITLQMEVWYIVSCFTYLHSLTSTRSSIPNPAIASTRTRKIGM